MFGADGVYTDAAAGFTVAVAPEIDRLASFSASVRLGALAIRRTCVSCWSLFLSSCTSRPFHLFFCVAPSVAMLPKVCLALSRTRFFFYICPSLQTCCLEFTSCSNVVPNTQSIRHPPTCVRISSSLPPAAHESSCFQSSDPVSGSSPTGCQPVLRPSATSSGTPEVCAVWI